MSQETNFPQRPFKGLRVWIFILVPIVAIGIILLAAVWSARNLTTAVAANKPEGTACIACGGEAFPPYDPAISPQYLVDLNTVRSVRGVDIELRSVQRQGEFIRADFCYRLPSSDDWELGITAEDVVLTVGGVDIPQRYAALTEGMYDGNVKGSRRCAYIVFPVPADLKENEYTITIYRFLTSTPDVPDCNKTQEKLNQAQAGIVIQCFDEVTDSGGVSGFDIIQKPDDMSDVQARKLVNDSFSEIVQGPWIFPITLPE